MTSAHHDPLARRIATGQSHPGPGGANLLLPAQPRAFAIYAVRYPSGPRAASAIFSALAAAGIGVPTLDLGSAHPADGGSTDESGAGEIDLEGPLGDQDRRRLLEIADRCPVHRTLSSEIAFDTTEA
jgi:hypothetical protein